MDSRAYLYTNQTYRQYIPNAPVVGTPENRERSDLRLALFLFVSPCKRFDCVGEVSDRRNQGFQAGNLDFSATSNGMGCHINDRLSDTHRNNDFDTEFVT